MKDDNQLSPWQAWSFEVQQKLKAQQDAITQLEGTLAQLCEQVKKLEAKPSQYIDKIQYHFDQLKVERLEGTLNIGMSVPGMGGDEEDNEDGQPGPIEQLTVGQGINKGNSYGNGYGTANGNDNVIGNGNGNGYGNLYPSASSTILPPDAIYNNIFRRINSFLETEAIPYIIQFEQEQGMTLDPHHRHIIVEDVRKQMPQRIHYYLQMQQKESPNQPGLYPDLWTDRIFAKTKRDAETAISAYMRTLKSSANGLQQGGKQDGSI